VRAKQSRYLPTVLSHEEAIAVISKLSGTYQLISQILYGSGLRLSEALTLRVKDIDFAQSQIIVRDGKGGNSRITYSP
jgi:integrase